MSKLDGWTKEETQDVEDADANALAQCMFRRGVRKAVEEVLKLKRNCPATIPPLRAFMPTDLVLVDDIKGLLKE